MGSNKRYADANQRRRFNRKSDARALAPRSPSEAELGTEAVRREDVVPIKAWVDYGSASAQMLRSAVAWMSQCVLVLWTDSHGQAQEA